MFLLLLYSNAKEIKRSFFFVFSRLYEALRFRSFRRVYCFSFAVLSLKSAFLLSLMRLKRFEIFFP